MYLFGRISVTSVVPDRIKRLEELARNLAWSWNHDAIDLYREIDLPLWDRLGKNPVRFLQEVSQKKLEAVVANENYIKRYNEIINRFDNYLNSKDTWFSKTFPDKANHLIAYFSAEYGLNEVLSIYSGGLGVLSGDHCKSASDLGLPFVALGLFYKQGYFSQHINKEGWQETKFTDLNYSRLPIQPAYTSEGKEAVISIELPGRMVYAKIWQIKVGRISIYMMDTDVESNSPPDRMLTARLYGGDQEMRICQEIFLGIGGIRALETLGLNPTVYHMNEGHSAFLGLELIKKLINEKGLSFKEAKEAISAATVFTTHTPVPAGNDVFPVFLIDKYFGSYWGSLGINRHEFLDLGTRAGEETQNFNMTILAMNIAGRRNGVSKLHGAVSRSIFGSAWRDVPEDEVPIGHITNGIHTLTWLSPVIEHLYDKYLPADWAERQYEIPIWDNVDNIPDRELWDAHNGLKKKMVNFIRDSLKEQKAANGESMDSIREVDRMLDYNALTIGFARRFATYKRANLIFRNLDRIKKILNREDMPVQIIFAGKAHPADRPAHEVIKQLYDIANQYGFKGKVVLVENYNMTVARNLVQGVDIWLNNPRRPLEASGTSGQKVCINGIPNFSILDGWWVEGYNGKNGWTIGDESHYDNEYSQDNADSESLYSILEEKIIPLYFERNSEGVPEGWVKVMKESIKSITPVFNTHRMVQDYTTQMYIPSINRVDSIKEGSYEFVKRLANWKVSVEKNWPQVQITVDGSFCQSRTEKIASGETLQFTTTIYLGNIDPSSVLVEIYYGRLNEYSSSGNGRFDDVRTVEMKFLDRVSESVYRYKGEITLRDGGEYGYTFRVIPYNQDLINKFEMGLVKWVV